jgi:SAM-dependent methyltransferase
MLQAKNIKVDPRQFWEDKILGWEEGRYKLNQKNSNLLERLANRASDSLRFRVEITPTLIAPFVQGKRIVELGCGSGLLAKRFIDAGAKSYLGIDIAESAILKARSLPGNSNAKIQFAVSGIEEMAPLECDIVISLGLIDWLTDDEIAKMFELCGKADYLHSIAERRISIQQYLHRLYVHFSYGRRTGAYRPRYLTVKQIKKLADLAAVRPIYVFRDNRLSFGAMVSSLPIKL